MSPREHVHLVAIKKEKVGFAEHGLQFCRGELLNGGGSSDPSNAKVCSMRWGLRLAYDGGQNRRDQ